MKKPSRRHFIKQTGLAIGATAVGIPNLIGKPAKTAHNHNHTSKMIEITRVDSNFEREPLIRPFGFKGGYMTEIWQSVAWMQSAGGHEALGLCTHNVLWSDAAVFASNSKSAGDALMFAISNRALQMIKGQCFKTPIDLQESILDELYAYAQKITNRKDLRKTFVLNALVGVDNAAWILYARENGLKRFDDMIPEAYRPALSHRNKQVASIPLMAYTIPISEIVEAVDQGYFFMKIKIGQPGTQQEMLEKDKERLTAIHKAIGHRQTPHTKTGRLPYYFDANGRYEKKESLLKLLDHAKKIGAYDQIAVIEEPFPEHARIDVSDIEIRLAADESAHTDKDALERIEMGYKAIALKSIAKTMSMTMKIAQTSYDNNVPCFCADLTVSPVLVEWNKTVAARLAPFPGLGMGLLETNGHQNYINWERMRSWHPYPNAEWARTVNGVFNVGDDFFEQSGGILETPGHYGDLVNR